MATTIIAAYAAVISTVAVGWQIYSWHRTHKSGFGSRSRRG
jgi:hypothetical protein